MMNSIRFYTFVAGFNIKEQFSDLLSAVMEFFLLPFYIWLISKLWQTFNSYQGHYTLDEVTLYVGLTEVLFMTFLRSSGLTRTTADFSLSLARPRSWILTSFAGFFGRCFGSRIIFIFFLSLTLPLLGVPIENMLEAFGRLFLILPLLGVFQALLNILFACAQIVWHETHYFILPIGKIFLALGGVFGPIIDFGEPWRSILIQLPPSDMFFQPAHFCLKGSFYSMSMSQWMLKIVFYIITLIIVNIFFYKWAKHQHQSLGG